MRLSLRPGCVGDGCARQRALCNCAGAWASRPGRRQCQACALDGASSARRSAQCKKSPEFHAHWSRPLSGWYLHSAVARRWRRPRCNAPSPPWHNLRCGLSALRVPCHASRHRRLSSLRRLSACAAHCATHTVGVADVAQLAARYCLSALQLTVSRAPLPLWLSLRHDLSASQATTPHAPPPRWLSSLRRLSVLQLTTHRVVAAAQLAAWPLSVAARHALTPLPRWLGLRHGVSASQLADASMPQTPLPLWLIVVSSVIVANSRFLVQRTPPPPWLGLRHCLSASQLAMPYAALPLWLSFRHGHMRAPYI